MSEAWHADDRPEEDDPADDVRSDRWDEVEDPKERGLPWEPPDLIPGEGKTERLK